MERRLSSKDGPAIVAAIDFGTTFSGFAISLAADPMKIMGNNWSTSGISAISDKAPTSVLLTPDQQFHSFGYEAEEKYSSLTESEEHKEWLYFKHFKMILHNTKDVRRSSLITDENGKTIEAMTIFSMVIQYMKDKVYLALSQHVLGFLESMVDWVITVPAVWDDRAKQFMREAAVNAGITDEKLVLALEPEAASLYCMTAPLCVSTADNQTHSLNFKPFDVGTRYLLLDMGGGTLDIAAHEVLPGKTIKQIHRARGKPIGGITIDAKFTKFITNLFGQDIVMKIKEKSSSDYLFLCREFAAKKISFNSKSTDDIIIRLPSIFIELFDELVCKTHPTQIDTADAEAQSENDKKEAKKKLRESRSKYIELSEFKDKLKIERDKLHINAHYFKSFFESALDGIIQKTEKVLSNIKKHIPIIILVGGLSESNIVQEKIRKTFHEKQIISPTEARLAVLKGAILFGYDPFKIRSRVMKSTYGVECSQYPFIKGKHPEEYKKWVNGHWSCSKCFDPFVLVDEEILVGHITTKRYTLNSEEANNEIDIYSSSSKPDFVTQCEKLGSVVLQCPDGGWPNDTNVTVNMKFGGTELTVSVTDTYLNRTYKAKYRCLRS